MKKQETAMDVARLYAEKYIKLALKNKKQYSKRYIASVMTEERPELFKNIELARSAIRKVTNCSGETEKNIKDIDLASRFALIPAQISEFETDEPFVIPKQYKKGLIISDLHGLFCDQGKLQIAINDGIKFGANFCFIDGDLFDHYAFSKFDKTPNITSSFLNYEREWAIDILQLLQDVFGKVFLKKGNHDYHRERAIQKMCERHAEFSAEFDDISNFENYIFFDNSTVEIIEMNRITHFGKLNIIHGHEYQGGGGIHVAYNRLNKAFDNILSAHSHISQSNGKQDINGDYFGSWTIGCMCGLHPRYAIQNNWNNGFALVERENSGNFEVFNKRIVKNKLFPA